MPPRPTPANAPAVTAIRCDHQIQTREGNAARRCTEQVPLTSFWGNQTGYESRLHCLQQDLDSQTQGYHQGRPHSWHGLPAHSAGVATSKEAYSANGQGILGLQRPALHRRGTAPDCYIPKIISSWSTNSREAILSFLRVNIMKLLSVKIIKETSNVSNEFIVSLK